MSDLTALWIVVLLLIGNAFFVGAEFALISARRTQIEPRAEAGSRAARVTLRGMENVSLMMAGAQLGITVCSLGLGAVGEPAVAYLIEPVFTAAGLPSALLRPVAFTVAMIIVVTLHMVLGEMVPKNIAIAAPQRSALVLGPPLYAVVTVLKPAIALLNWFANIVLRVLRVQPQDEVTSTFTADEVAGFIAQSRREGLLDEDEHELLTGALTFTRGQVRNVLLGMSELVTVPEEVTVAQLHEACATTGFSRFPVRDHAGDLTAYIHLKDVLDIPDGHGEEPVHRKWLRPLVTVAPDQSLREALVVMQAQGAHMARVVEPHTGGVLGVAALEDVLEELVGDVVDAGQNIGTTPSA
ncbi:MAG TPA: hemolysin family protein [Dermatophilaceae bacterium]|nr:hemolysin family protein [Dermatophilaceae bacterium]